MKVNRPVEPVPLPPDAPPHLRDALAHAAPGAPRSAAYLALARHYRNHSLRTALPLAQAALDWALSAGTPDATVVALAGLASIEVTQGKQEQAFEHLALALDLAQEHALHHLEAQVRNTRAVARLTAGDVTGARRDLLDAQALGQASGDVMDQVNAHINLAYLANLSGHHADALHQLNLLEELLFSLPEEEQLAVRPYLHENRAHIYLNLARRARERGRPDAEAEARARTAAAIEATRAALARFPDRLLALTTEAHAARLALLEGDLERAQRHAQASLDHHHEVGQRVYLDAHLTLAEVSEATGQLLQAHQQYRVALDLARQQGRHRESQAVLEALTRLYEQEGDLAAALATCREALASAQQALAQLAHIEQRNDDLSRELRLARAEANTWQESVRRAEAQARQDPLTGLLNRRGLRDAVAQLEGQSGPLLVALFDIDHFKAVNDQHSHMVGDVALQAVAARLSAHLPAGSLLSRHGGEEFLLVLPGVDPAQAPALVERLRKAVASHTWPDLPCGLRLTVSAGYALAAEAEEAAFRAALEQADEQLYQAKQAGRNRVSPPVRVPGPGCTAP
ncbi:diguanylate cyclase [Deinococcus sp. YIM 77859]|uniref:GGDEF domain-containing protein n=1 Tax=Deinococcus sp. YIM 77859 TaxID=1540221 RepID=UPI000557C58F|nr:diguanylate cyclase [Deinococcus sp. YIM 77859]